MTAGHVVLLAGGGLLAGALNGAAGGGSLISFPALLAVGYPALTANVTNTIALCPGYLGGVLGYRPELAGQRPRALPLAGAAVLGSLLGVALLQLSSQGAFRTAVPFLVLAACALLAAQPAVGRRLHARRGAAPHRAGGGEARPGPALLGATAVGGAYGAYFGAALGVALLALFGVAIEDTLQRLNALKALMALVVNVAAAICLAVLGPVAWAAVPIVAPTALVGGRLGVLAARRLSDRALRLGVVAFGVVVAAVLLATGG